MLEAAEPVPSKLRGLDPPLSGPPTTAEAVVPTCTPHVSISKRSGRGGAGAGAGSSSGTMNSMTLAISHENAKRMLEASRAFNATLNKIQNQQGQSQGHGKVQIKAEANVPDHVRSTGAVSKTDGTTEKDSSKQQDPNAPKSPPNKKTLHELFLQAALASENELLVSHVQRMKKAVADGTYTNQEIKTCLLLFLDMDKSSKLLTAFEILGDETTADEAMEIDPDSKEAAKVSSEQTAKDESDERKLPTLTRVNLMKMFRCFLSSISTCIHHQVAESSERKNELDSTDRPSKFSKPSKIDSPGSARSKQPDNTKDWTLSSQTCLEIQEIATYATSRVIEHKFDEGTTSRTKAQSSEIISFQRFGSWYNSGGFSLVPWLELLDLAKWDYAGRAAAAAAAAANAKEKHQHSKRPKSLNLDPMSMDPIMEEDMDDFVLGVDSSSSSHSIGAGANIDSDLCFSSQSATKPKEKVSSKPKESQRPLIYFEFAGSKEDSIKINEYNLRALQNLVEKTGLSRRPPDEISNMFMKPAKRRRIPLSTKANTTMKGEPRLEEVLLVLSRDDFDNILQQLISPLKQLSPTEKEFILKCFTIFFLCFAKSNNISSSGLGLNHVNAKELAVGLSFLCVGNKSSKLASTFELIQEQSNGFLSQRSMLRYLRSYLSMLAAISLLSSSSSDLGEVTKDLSSQDGGSASLRRLLDSVEKGSRWTLDHFLRLHESKSKKEKKKTHITMYTFEDFASWYSEGGCTIAPWLEFIDLKKFLSLLYEDEYTRGSVPSRKTSNPSSGFDDVFEASPGPGPGLKGPSKGSSASKHSVLPEHILFTFPLANRKSLVVLREDAAYVQTVVNQLGLLSSTPEKVWSELHSYAKSNPPPALIDQFSKRHRSGTGKCLDVAQSTFVSALERVIPKSNPGKRSASSSTPQETLKNFFQSFDLNQVDRVAANQLMGGLTLLCEGKKSSKLKFAFGLFDTRDDKRKKADQSLCGKELFYFLRSFLIVMFSCCKQSLDLSANAVGRYISDTANMVTDDVMKYQWRTKRSDRVSFDEFGEWYNEGGFETASWLELLDLNKWVLLDKAKAEKLMSESNKPMKNRVSGGNKLKDKSNTHEEKKSSKKADIKKESESIPECPPPPPEDFLDAHTDMLFDDDIAMGGIDDMDFLFSDASVAQDKENMKGLFGIDCNIDEGILPEPVGISAASPTPKTLPLEHEESAKPLKFQLLTDVGQGGYMISISSRRVKLLKLLVTESDLFTHNIRETSEKILAQAVDGKLSKELFDDAMRDIIAISKSTGSKMTTDTQRLLSDLLSSVFSAFDFEKTGMVDANDLACGFTVLCGGRKSDKLEYAFDLLDKRSGNHGASKNEMVRYLQSFLTVLLTISSCSVGREAHENILRTLSGDTVTGKESSDLSSAIIWGSTWATNQMLKSLPIDDKSYEGKNRINFENFAEWYTKGGFSVIPWLELLDLRKWVLAELI